MVEVWARANASMRALCVLLTGLSVGLAVTQALLDVRTTTPRSDELAIGYAARAHAAQALLIDTSDYGYFAVLAAYGDPARGAPIDDRDPRKPRPPDPFTSAAAFDAWLAARLPTWLVTTRGHAQLAAPHCALEDENASFVLLRCDGRSTAPR